MQYNWINPLTGGQLRLHEWTQLLLQSLNQPQTSILSISLPLNTEQCRAYTEITEIRWMCSLSCERLKGQFTILTLDLALCYFEFMTSKKCYVLSQIFGTRHKDPMQGWNPSLSLCRITLRRASTCDWRNATQRKALCYSGLQLHWEIAWVRVSIA